EAPWTACHCPTTAGVSSVTAGGNPPARGRKADRIMDSPHPVEGHRPDVGRRDSRATSASPPHQTPGSPAGFNESGLEGGAELPRDSTVRPGAPLRVARRTGTRFSVSADDGPVRPTIR